MGSQYECLACIGKKWKPAPIWETPSPSLILDKPRSTLNGKSQDDKGGTVMPYCMVSYGLVLRYGTVMPYCTERDDMSGGTMPYFTAQVDRRQDLQRKGKDGMR